MSNVPKEKTVIAQLKATDSDHTGATTSTSTARFTKFRNCSMALS